MSSEMRELIAKWREMAARGPDPNYDEHGIGPGELTSCANELEDILARTEAGADGADLIQWRYTNAETGEVLTPWTECDAAFREKRKDAPGYQFRELFTHPQDASGDAAKLGAFAASILNLDEDWIGDVDGGTLQDAAEKYALLQAVEVTEACGEGCNCAGYGDFPQTCYRPTDTMKRAMQAKEAK